MERPFETTGSHLEVTKPDLTIFLINCRRWGPITCRFSTLSLFIKLLDKLSSKTPPFFKKKKKGNLLCIMLGTTVSAPSCKGENDKPIFFKDNILFLWMVNSHLTSLKSWNFLQKCCVEVSCISNGFAQRRELHSSMQREFKSQWPCSNLEATGSNPYKSVFKARKSSW